MSKISGNSQKTIKFTSYEKHCQNTSGHRPFCSDRRPGRGSFRPDTLPYFFRQFIFQQFIFEQFAIEKFVFEQFAQPVFQRQQAIFRQLAFRQFFVGEPSLDIFVLLQPDPLVFDREPSLDVFVICEPSFDVFVLLQPDPLVFDRDQVDFVQRQPSFVFDSDPLVFGRPPRINFHRNAINVHPCCNSFAADDIRDIAIFRFCAPFHYWSQDEDSDFQGIVCNRRQPRARAQS